MRPRLVLGLLAWVLATGGLPAAGQAANEVAIYSNFFEPRELHVAPGETVTWRAEQDGHTVTADDGRFNFYPTRTLNRGETVQWTFLTDETVRYYCRIHGGRGGSGMAGVIVVGAGSPTPTPPATPAPTADLLVPDDYPTIGAALAAAPPGAAVSVRPGRYPESVTVSVPGLTLRGLGASPEDVVLDGEGRRVTGITVAAGGVRVENLSVRGYATRGLFVVGVEGFSVERVVAEQNGLEGVSVSDSMRGALRGLRASGSSRAGIAVAQCADCDVVVEDAEASGNAYGLLAQNAGGVVVHRSRFVGNRTGVVVRSVATRDQTLSRGVHLVGNVIAEDASRPAPRPSDPLADPPVGAGVWLGGAWHAVVEGNQISGGGYGVLVTWWTLPTVDARVASNTVSTSGAGLAWDGLGERVCFASNTGPNGGEPSSEPPAAQALYPCGRSTVGLPYPPPLMAVLLAAAGA